MGRSEDKGGKKQPEVDVEDFNRVMQNEYTSLKDIIISECRQVIDE